MSTRPRKVTRDAKKPARAKPRAPARALGPARLVHELEVHQAELRSQNEELQSAGRELEAALARYTELFDFAPVGYVVLDDQDVIQKLNHVAARLLSAPRARLAGKPFPGRLGADDLAVFTALARRVRASGEPAHCELRVGATVLRVQATAQPAEASGLLLAIDDITERKAVRDQLAGSVRALQESNQRKDQFIAMLSHELRNPLASIRSSVAELAHREVGAETAAEAHDIADRQLAHLARLIDDLLDVSRINSGTTRLEREHVDLVALVEQVVADHRAGFEANEIALGLSCAGGPVWVDIDRTRVGQVLNNLLGNAQKFTPNGGRVEVVLERRGRSVVLRVGDTGAGIASELLPHVFEPFTQAPQTIDRSRSGLGLGLALVKGLVELHGGQVRIASEGLGRGTEVTITLPATRPRELAAPAPVRMPRLTSRRVLVIEDHPDAARALETVLTTVGLDVRVAGTGRDGLEIARTFRPEVVLCDLGLPGMDGYEVARAFRRDRDLRETYLVALSGYAQPADVARTTAAGFSRHLAKPASVDALVAVIARAPAIG